MKTIIVSSGDERRWHTLVKLHERVDAIVVAHDRKTAAVIRKAFPFFDVMVSGTTKLVDKRNWILEKVVAKNEWFMGMDDNIQYFTMVQEPYRSQAVNDTVNDAPVNYKNWREVYNHRVSYKAWKREFMLDIDIAKNQNIPLVGVASLENPWMRQKRYSNYKFVKTKIYAMKNTRKFWFENDVSHDSWLTAMCIAVHGKVLVDSFLHHKVRMYEVGGLGTRAEREAKGLIKFMNHTIESFPGLMRIGHGKNTALAMRLHNEHTVQMWRRQNGYIK